jgi:hypothetical protein
MGLGNPTRRVSLGLARDPAGPKWDSAAGQIS